MSTTSSSRRKPRTTASSSLGVVLALTALAAACGGRPRETFLTYFNGDHGVSLRHAASWRADQAEQDGVWYRYLPPTGPRTRRLGHPPRRPPRVRGGAGHLPGRPSWEHARGAPGHTSVLVLSSRRRHFSLSSSPTRRLRPHMRGLRQPRSTWTRGGSELHPRATPDPSQAEGHDASCASLPGRGPLSGGQVLQYTSRLMGERQTVHAAP
jgi:hypothetical protein